MATSTKKHSASRAPPAPEEVTEVVKAAEGWRREAVLPVAWLDTSKEPLSVLETWLSDEDESSESYSNILPVLPAARLDTSKEPLCPGPGDLDL